MQTTQPFLEV